MRRPDGLLVVCGLTAALLLAAPTVGNAQVSKCQAALEKEMGKLEKDLYLRMNKCADAIRKERDKGLLGANPKGSLAKAAVFCEKMLRKTIDVERLDAGKSKLDKFFAGVDKAGTKCDGSGLRDLGQFESGVNAPPLSTSDPLEFVKNFLGVQAIHAAWRNQVLANDEMRTRIQDAIDAPSDTKGNAATDCSGGACSGGPTPGALCGFNVDCGAGGSCVGGTINRPNLCAFHKDTSSVGNGLAPLAGTLNPVCRMHACELLKGNGVIGGEEDSEAEITGPGLQIVAGIDGTLMFDVCDLRNLPAPFTLRDYFLISGTASTGIRAVDLGALVGKVCIRNYRLVGWCDCAAGGSGLPVLNSFSCQDHLVDPNSTAGLCDGGGNDGLACDLNDPNLPGGTCPGGECRVQDDCGERPSEAAEEECVCAPPTDLYCGTGNGCHPRRPFERCKNDSECSTSGDLCIAKESGGRCHAGTWTGKQLIELGGSTQEGDCLLFSTSSLTLIPDPNDPEDAGPDGRPCTDDDAVPQSADGLVPLTTGQADAAVEDGIEADPVCAAGRLGDFCLEHSNCDVNPGFCLAGNPGAPCPSPVCTAPPGSIGDACTKDADCDSIPDSGDGVCDLTRNAACDSSPAQGDGLCGTGYCDTSVGLLVSISSRAPVSGNSLECADLETSNLADFSLAGAFPIVDGASLGDLVFTYRFVCE